LIILHYIQQIQKVGKLPKNIIQLVTQLYEIT